MGRILELFAALNGVGAFATFVGYRWKRGKAKAEQVLRLEKMQETEERDGRSDR